MDHTRLKNIDSNSLNTSKSRKQSQIPSYDLLALDDLKKLKTVYEDYQILFLVGYPSDVSAHNCDGRTGQELGPTSFREIRQNCNLPMDYSNENINSQQQQLYGVNIEGVKLKVVDCGNVESVYGELEQTQDNLRKYIEGLTRIVPDSIVIVIGGTDDMNYPVLQSLVSTSQQNNQNFHLIRIDPQTDIEEKYRKQFDDLEPTFHEHNQSHFRMVLENADIMKKLNRVTFFGLQGHKVSMDQIEKLNAISKDKFEYVFYDKHIRRYIQSQQEKEIGWYNPTIILDKIIKKQRYINDTPNKKNTQQQDLIVCIDMQSIKSQYALGVSEPCPAFGFNIQEVEEMSLYLGELKNLRVVTISEYNPAIEKTRTGNILNSIYHNLLLGIAKRLNKEGKFKEVILEQNIKQNLQLQLQEQELYVYSSMLD